MYYIIHYVHILYVCHIFYIIYVIYTYSAITQHTYTPLSQYNIVYHESLVIKLFYL